MAQMAQALPFADALKAGNRTQFLVEQKVDPVFQAYAKYNTQLVLSGPAPSGTEEPTQDNKGYAIDGSTQLFCRPQVKVSERIGLTRSPDVRFERRDDGDHLLVTFEEDYQSRPANSAPFPVTVKGVKLAYGTNVLAFEAPILDPIQAAPSTPAFRIMAEMRVPESIRPGLVAAMQQTSSDKPTWIVNLEFQWVKVTVVPSPSPKSNPPVVTPPIMRLPIGIVPGVRFTAIARDAQSDPSVESDQPARNVEFMPAATAMMARPDMLRAIITAPPPPPPPPLPPQQIRENKTIALDRLLPAAYPNPNDPYHRPIYAALDGVNDGLGWRNSPFGWYSPSAVQDCVYTAPDKYLLEVDTVTGYPSISGVLMRKSDTGQLVDDLDPKLYKMRLTIRAKPDFDPERLNSLRGLIRSESSNDIKYADLVIGGYKAARFLADDSLNGLGELFAGSTAGNQDNINPEAGFALTYEGNGEFIDLIFHRLKNEGIRGYVEFDLDEPNGNIRKLKVPVELTIHHCAPISLRLTMAPSPDPAHLSNDFQVTNLTPVPVEVDGIQATALLKLPYIHRVTDTIAVTPEAGNAPFTLAANESKPIHLVPEKPDAVYNAWDVGLLGCRPVLDQNRVLNYLFDAATSGVRGWTIEVECAPFAFFDRLKPEDQEALKDVIAVEVEVRRADNEVAIEEVRLTRDKPRGQVLLSRTLADFVSDRATAISRFKYRQRLLKITSPGGFGDWKEETGSSVTIYTA